MHSNAAYILNYICIGREIHYCYERVRHCPPVGGGLRGGRVRDERRTTLGGTLHDALLPRHVGCGRQTTEESSPSGQSLCAAAPSRGLAAAGRFDSLLCRRPLDDDAPQCGSASRSQRQNKPSLLRQFAVVPLRRYRATR